jgi:hypothetical protein
MSVDNGVRVIEIRQLQLDTEINAPPHVEGRVYWDDNANTLAVMTDVSDVVVQVGQEMHVKARNDTGATIENGSVVYITGATGNRPTVAKAQANGATTSNILGVATADIENNTDGYITVAGLVRGLNTNAYAEGDTLYLSESTAGGLRNSQPDAPNFTVRIGKVTRKNPSVGVILVALDGNQAFGDIAGGTSYSQFEPDGTYAAYGSATVWRDKNFDPAQFTKGAGAPDLTDINGTNIEVVAFDGVNTTEEVSAWSEHPHEAKQNADIVPHIHWAPTTGDSGSVQWNIDYYMFESGTLFGSGALTQAQAAPGSAWQETRLDMGTIGGGSLIIGAQIGLRLWRDPSDGNDTYTHDAVVTTFGYHYEIDTIGSREIVEK